MTQERFGLKKRTLNVRFTPNSGHKWLWRGMSAFDPKRTLVKLGAATRETLIALCGLLTGLGRRTTVISAAIS